MENQPQNTALASLKRHDEHWQALIKKIQAMTLMDDVFFNCFMEDDIKAMEYILNTIMDKYDLKVIRLRTQHSVPNIYGRSVRFDVFATDQHGTEYNFEVQNASSGASPKRARYNSDMLDLRKLEAGDDFEALPETYVIFITAKDVLGHGLPIYHIDRHINELGIKFDDKAHIIYVNGENTSSTPLGMLMQDFQQSDPAKMHSRLLANKMKQLKSVDEEVSKMCNIVEEYVAERLAEEKAKVAEAEAEIAKTKAEAARAEARIAKAEAETAKAEAKTARAEAKTARAEAKVAEAEKKAATAKATSNLNCIKNLMKSMQLSAEDAMHAIGIPPAEHIHYLAML